MSERHIKAISTKGGIDGVYILDVAKYQAKRWLQINRNESPIKCAQKSGLIAKLAERLARSLLGRVMDMEQRIAQLEISKGIDVEITDELAKCLERVDRMESSLAERTIAYRGYWREGMKSKRGDAVTQDGSLWIAVRATDEKPANHSTDWCLAARKGRDA